MISYGDILPLNNADAPTRSVLWGRVIKNEFLLQDSSSISSSENYFGPESIGLRGARDGDKKCIFGVGTKPASSSFILKDEYSPEVLAP